MEDAVEFFGGEDYGVASGEGEEVEAGELFGLGGEGEGLGSCSCPHHPHATPTPPPRT